jgi:hypothetical protein
MVNDSAVKVLLPSIHMMPTVLDCMTGAPATRAPMHVKATASAMVDCGLRPKQRNSMPRAKATEVRRKHKNKGTSMTRMP